MSFTYLGQGFSVFRKWSYAELQPIKDTNIWRILLSLYTLKQHNKQLLLNYQTWAWDKCDKYFRFVWYTAECKMKHYRAKASAHGTISYLGLSTIELGGWYTAYHAVIKSESAAWTGVTTTMCTVWLNHVARHRHICNLASHNHVPISWWVSKKAINPRTKDSQRKSL